MTEFFSQQQQATGHKFVLKGFQVYFHTMFNISILNCIMKHWFLSATGLWHIGRKILIKFEKCIDIKCLKRQERDKIWLRENLASKLIIFYTDTIDGGM